MPVHRKAIRLPLLSYVGTKARFVTICCDRRSPYLENPPTARRVLSTLCECAAKRFFLLHAYSAMPDHLHFLAHGTQPTSNLFELVRVFKLRTAYDFKKESNRRLWEMSFYDHILRKGDEIEGVACYIWANPVRKQLCTRPEDYPFSGSQTIEWIKKSRTGQQFFPVWRSTPPV